MNKTLVILARELQGTLKRKGFLITTFALPVLGMLAMLVYYLVSGINPSPETEITRVGYVDRTGQFTQYTQQDKIELVSYPTEEQATADLVAGKVKEYFVIPDNYMATGSISRYTLRTDIQLPSDIMQATQKFLINNLIQGKVSPEVAARIQYPLSVSSVVLDKTGNVADGQGGFGAWIIAYLFGFLLLMSIFTASGYLLQGLSEEKENRVMEVLLSSVSTRQLITGKVLGLGIAGLLQMVLWLLSAWGLFTIASNSIAGAFGAVQFPMSVMALSLVYYILGYFLFAILLAGVGAIVPTVRDGQQLSVVVTLLGAIPFVLMTFIIENGDHILNIILTLFPPTAPMTVMMRLNAGIPIWELAMSIVLMVLSIIGCLLLASKLFRTYLLMYGKTPGLKELVRSLRQA
jgi:ABC-2 type transport system permease protein